MTEGPMKISPAIPERPFPIPTMPPQKQSVHKSDTMSSLKHENAGEPPLSDTGLEKLRKKITETMLALLVKVFEWKLSLDKSRSSSRLERSSVESPDVIKKQLGSLQSDLEKLIIWAQTALKQIDKALEDPRKPSPSQPKAGSPQKKESDNIFGNFLSLLKKWYGS